MDELKVKVLAKTARLVRLVAERPGSSASALAARTGEPRPTVYRLLQDLVALGYLEEGPRPGTYRLGLELFRLGSVVAGGMDVRQRAVPVMRELHAALEETVFLIVRRRFDAVCIERVDGVHIRSMALQLGGSLPLHLGAGPRALLAFESPELWEEYLSAVPLQAMTPRSPVTASGIMALLQQTRQSGYAVSDEDVTMGIASVGAPVFDHAGAVCGALSVGGLRSAVLGEGAGEDAVKLVVQGAAEISRGLGWEEQR